MGSRRVPHEDKLVLLTPLIGGVLQDADAKVQLSLSEGSSRLGVARCVCLAARAFVRTVWMSMHESQPSSFLWRVRGGRWFLAWSPALLSMALLLWLNNSWSAL